MSELSILSASERCRVVEEFNAAYSRQEHDRLIHHLFEAQAEAAPQAQALVCADGSLTYGELNRKANQLARCLREHGAAPGRLVALCMERSTDLIVGLLAILKAGAAYVPLDPGYPAERLRQMLLDAAPCAVLAQQSLLPMLHWNPAPVVAIEHHREFIEAQDDGNLDAAVIGTTPHDLAYVIYTSGSTGHPKGVMVEHCNLTSSTLARARVYGPPGRFLLVSSVAFDSSVAGIFGTLTGGGTLCIATAPAMRDLSLLDREIHRWRITSLLCVPTVYQKLLEFHPRVRESSLARVIVAGEVCTAELVAASRSAAAHIALFNEYGPTETTVWASVYRCEDQPADRIPIGRPIANTQIYILDEHLQPVPVGITGEICIGGAGVARGYLNRPAATAERFVSHPFQAPRAGDMHSRVYRTGDLGCWRADGNIEYLGRNDHQVKLRGFRIELGEIEAQLLRHPDIRQAVVLLREDTSPRLVAYLVCGTERQPPAEELRTHLASQLPNHMVPSAFVTLEALPLLPNGKLDRRALPAPEPSSFSSQPYQPPQGSIETMLAAIWMQLLHIERVSRHDDFFELGGHSLQALLVIAQVQDSMGLEMSVGTLFDGPTLHEMASRIETIRGVREDAAGRFAALASGETHAVI